MPLGVVGGTLEGNQEQSRKYFRMGSEFPFRALAAPALFSLALALPGFSAAADPVGDPAATGLPVPAPVSAPAVAPVLPVPPVKLAPEAEAFRAALRAELSGADDRLLAGIEQFYGARDWRPFWSEPGSGRAAALVAALGSSPAQGLPAYDVAGVQETAAGAAAAAPELAASRAYLAYAGDLTSGVVTPSRIDPDIAVRPKRLDPAALLARAAAGPVEAALAGLAPRDPDYARLIAEKARLEGLLRADAWGPAVADGPTLHAGDRDPRVGALRARLGHLGHAAPAGTGGADVFDAGLVLAVQAFQRDSGLNDDGAAGSRTVRAANATPEHRLAQVLVNLERMRWLQRDPAERALRVNIPDFTVVLDDGGREVWKSRVVVGETPKTRTAEFSKMMTYMVVNPTWHIPDSIAIRTYLPKAQRDPGVFARNNIRLFTRGGTEINPRLVDFTQYTPENFPFRIKQKPNDDNALGQVKFMFPNDFSIYMHDTPHRELFPRDARAFSNGCIRLEKPVELAHILLTGQVDDPVAAYAAWRAAKTERTVQLVNPIMVHIEYRTAFGMPDGMIRYRSDIYGRDAEVFQALEAAGVAMPAAQG